MIVRQYLHTEPAVAASYLFGCGGKARGAVSEENAFVDLMLQEFPPRPAHFADIRAENLGREPAAVG